MVEHAIDGVKVFAGFIVQLLCLGLEFLETALGVDVDGVLGGLADVELGFELLRRLRLRLSALRAQPFAASFSIVLFAVRPVAGGVGLERTAR